MSNLRIAAQQALEALEEFCEHQTMLRPIEKRESLKAALAEPVQEPDDKAASIRWQLCLLAQTEEFSDEVRNQIGRGVWLIDRLRAALAEPQEPDSPERRCGGPGCDGTCCQPVEEPVQDRALQWGAAPVRIELGGNPNGWREAFLPLGKDNTLRLLAETEALPLVESALRTALAEPAPDWSICPACGGMASDPIVPQRPAEPVQEPQRKPLSVTDLQDALVYTCLIDRDAIEDPEGYDTGSTVAQINALHEILTRKPT